MKQKIYHYEDIINLPHPTSPKHPRMSLYDRAAQFSPFAALTGHEKAIEETRRLTEEKMELDEEEKAKLNEKLRILQKNINQNKQITITYFVPDERKTGGAYVTSTGTLKKIDVYNKNLILNGDIIIPMDEIKKIEELES